MASAAKHRELPQPAVQLAVVQMQDFHGARSSGSRLPQVLLSFPDAVPLGVECFRDRHSPQLKLNPPDDYIIKKGAPDSKAPSSGCQQAFRKLTAAAAIPALSWVLASL